jgi:hypothetical protein
MIPGAPDLQQYQWPLPAAVHPDIAPREGAYEYIDGAFRPDTKKLLSLLSGSALYQSPFDAVRELVQNAFDAVSERIAYLRLHQPNPASTILASELARQHRVSLRLETEGDDSYLVCTDNGIGMSKAVIRDRILVSGSSPRHDVRALGRKCKDAGFDLGRSGQFGIGLLSYFMIASNVEIETRRAQEADDSDSATWRFETEGIGSFGELRRLNTNRQGSQIRLRLNSQISANLAEWFMSLRSYLTRLLIHCPCEFHFGAALPECQTLELEPGWSPYDYNRTAFSGLRNEPKTTSSAFNLLSSAERERRLAAERETDELEQQFQARLRWRREEGVLSGGTAQYVIQVPYFELDGGLSIAFLKSSSRGKKVEIQGFRNGTHHRPRGGLQEAWKGMAVATDPGGVPHGAFVRINWTSDTVGTIMVHRHRIVPDKAGNGCRAEIFAHCRRMIDQLLAGHKDSQFAWLNGRIAGSAQIDASDCRWICHKRAQEPTERADRGLLLAKVQFPAFSSSALGFAGTWDGARKLYLGKRIVHRLPWSSSAPQTYKDLYGIGWNSAVMAPDRVLHYDRQIVPLWDRRPRHSASSHWLVSKFPPEWHGLSGVRFAWYAGDDEPAHVWNNAHPLVRQANASARGWCAQVFNASIDPIPYRTKLLSDRSIAAAWLLQCVGQDSSEIWGGLPERDPGFLPELFSLVFANEKDPRLLVWIQDRSPAESRLRIVNAAKWLASKDAKVIEQYLPTPSAAWRLRRADDPAQARTTQRRYR